MCRWKCGLGVGLVVFEILGYNLVDMPFKQL